MAVAAIVVMGLPLTAQAAEAVDGGGVLRASVPMPTAGLSKAAAPFIRVGATTLAQDATGSIQTTHSVTRVSSGKGEFRAGDILQYHVVVKNTGTTSWTAQNPLTFATDLSGLVDDAVLIGVRHGSHWNNCSATGWYGANESGCVFADSSDPTKVSASFPLNAGASHYINYRVQVTDDFLAGDGRLTNVLDISGDPGSGAPLVTSQVLFDAEIEQNHPGLRIVNEVVTKVSGNKTGPVRAGDILQYHVQVQNPVGSGDWTAKTAWSSEKLLTFATDLSGLVDDAVLIGVRHGSHWNNCSATGWYGANESGCVFADSSDPTNVSASFSLNAGASYYINYRVQVTDDFLAGDGRLTNTLHVTGDPGNDGEVVSVEADFDHGIEQNHPDLTVVKSVVTNISTGKTDVIRAGDILQYHVQVQNPAGSGDWTAKTGWSSAKLLTFTTDLSGLGDDAVLMGVRHGSHWNNCSATGWYGANESGCVFADSTDPTNVSASFPLNAGGSYYINYRVQVTDDFLAGDGRLTNTLNISGDPGNGGSVVERIVDFADPIKQNHPDLTVVKSVVTNISTGKTDVIRAGDILQYHVQVQNPVGSGDWTAKTAWSSEKLLTFATDLSGLTDDAVLTGVRHGWSNYNCGPTAWYGSDESGCVFADTSDPTTVSASFPLKAGASYFINYRVQVTDDFVAGDGRLTNILDVSGDPGNGGEVVAVQATFDHAIEQNHPGLTIVNEVVTKISGDKTGPVRAGDILQYHVQVQNPVGSGDWTAKTAWSSEKLLTFATDLSGLTDDAVLTGVRHGWSSYNCGPTAWYGADESGCVFADTSDPTTVSASFPLKAGASYFINYRVQVTNDFVTGDGRLTNDLTFTGDPRNDGDIVTKIADFNHEIEQEHPDLEISVPKITKIVGKAGGPIQAGDVLQYHVTVKNPGLGDWTAAAPWADERLVTFETDLSGLIDDATLTGVRHGWSSYNCGPTAWYGSDESGCVFADTSDPTTVSASFPLKAGATHYITYRITVSDQYLGDQTLFNEVCASGEPGNGQDPIRTCASVSSDLAVQFPKLAVEKSVENITRPGVEPVRAGDVLEYTVKVRNPGKADWSAGTAGLERNLLTFSDDLSGVLDDAVWVDGSPEGCFYGSCDRFSEPENGVLSAEFALGAGATKTLTYRVKVSDAFTGDQMLTNTACATGDTRGPAGVVNECATVETPMIVQYPDASIDLTWEKWPDAKGAVRAGDVVEYTITVKNTGEGDWNMPSTWAVGSPLNLGMDLSDILDDATYRGDVSGGATVENGQLTWTGALAAGATKRFVFTVRVGENADGSGTDQLLNGEACVTGDTRNPALDPTEIVRCALAEIPVGERWRMSKEAFDASGDPLADGAAVHPGDLITYKVTASVIGGWPVFDMVLTDDLGGVLDRADVTGPITLEITGQEPKTLSVVGGQITTPAFDLPASGTATLVYTVQVAEDVHRGTLRNSATGTAQGSNGSELAPQTCGTDGRPCETEHHITTARPVIEKTATAGATVAPGDLVAYTVRVTNPGPGAWSTRNPLSIIDDLGDVLDDARLVSENVQVTTSTDPIVRTVPIVDGVISWQGALGAGEWIELTYAITVKDFPAEGDRVLTNEACTGAVAAESACAEVTFTIPLVGEEIEVPQWGPSEDGCVAPPWIDLPVTPGIVYTITGEVVAGGSVTVTATPRPGYELIVPTGWTPAPDGGSASMTVHFPTCEPKKWATPHVKWTNGGCSADGGDPVPPTLTLVETEGIEYSYTGDIVAGGTVVVTATALDGYLLTNSGHLQNWSISDDGLTATYTIRFPVPDCEPIEPSLPLIDPPLPSWTGPTCEFPDREPTLDVPTKEGLTYVVTGTVAIGETVTITVTADDGRALGWEHGWSYSADGKTATYTVTFALPTGCDGGGDGGDIGGPGEGGGDNGGDGDGGENGGDGGDGNGGGENPDEPGNGIDIEIPPFPSIPEPECVAGDAVMPDLRVIMVPGVWYDIDGKIAPGETVILTAHTLPGYILKNTADWMTGEWVVAPDRKSATRTVVFPPLEDICGLPVDPEIPPVDPPVDPEVPPVDPEVPPVDPEEPADPEVPPVDPEEPIEPELPPVTPGRPDPERPELATTGANVPVIAVASGAMLLLVGLVLRLLFPRRTRA